ncbi:MAG: CoB--CoM heterodisulfide reductase iron-sulfur subunit B family protein [Deltaproteobacteria bacterium]|nr:CoB--CoM heterodisulfide reductase iron-sulfur subunit B family protein [Deltaproteobacteria bacterium]
MKISYYPGCSLEGTASDYEASIHAICAALDIELVDLPDWSCCGATAAHSINHKAAIELAGRNVAIAEKQEMDMMVPCPLCFNRLKTAEKVLTGPEKNNYRYILSGDKVRILDIVNFLADEKILQQIHSKIVTPLTHLKTVCYYGCQSSRPPEITGAKDYENPMGMDRILKTLGANPIQWSFKTDCCGASHILPLQDVAFTMIEKLYKGAVEAKASCFVVSCQMCQLNLDAYQTRINQALGTDYYLPVLYITELIGMATGQAEYTNWFGRHFVDPGRMLTECGLA